MNISPNSRIWVYQSNRFLTAAEVVQIQQKLDDFTSQWQAHGASLYALGEVRHNLFIILSVDESQAGATGCSIDKSVNLMKEIEQEHGVELFDRFRVACRQQGELRSCSRAEFEQMLSSGEAGPDTMVFNNMIQTRAELDTAWEVPVKESWHGRVFQVK